MNELLELLDPVAESAMSPLPDPDEISYYVLEKERKLYLDDDVAADTIMAIQRMILRWNIEDVNVAPENRKPIHIYIMSYGGDMDYMWGLIDTMQTSQTPIITVNLGQADSAAALIFIAGHRRIMMPRAKVIIHEGSASMAGDSTKVLDASDSYRRSIKQMKDYILSRTNIPPKMLYKKRNNDWELDSAFCIENGVCDLIVTDINQII